MIGIPKTPEEISPEWLNTALSSNKLFKSQVVSHKSKRIGENTGFIGYLVRIELTYSEIDENSPASIIAKLSPTDPELLERFKENFIREVKFYEELAAGKDIPVPKCYYLDLIPETGESILLLEDLSHLRAASFINGCTEEETEKGVVGLAKIHASWWGKPKLLDLDWFFSFNDMKYEEFWALYPERLNSILPNFPVPKSYFKVGEFIGNKMAEIVTQLEGPPFTCIHRDPHVDNFLFGVENSEEPVVAVDWQFVGRGKGVSDIAYFLISSVPSEIRRKSEKAFLEKYHNYLLNSGVEGYSFDDCWYDYKLSAVVKFFITVIATVLIDNSNPYRVAWRKVDLQRLIAFIEDHNVEQLL